jgi:shikimate dehydrogenase
LPMCRRTGLVGSGIGYSLSPQLHEAEGDALGLAVEYVLLDIAQQPGELSSAEHLIRWAGENCFVGVNVTVPHKRAALSVVDSHDELSEFLEAINTVVFLPDGSSRGYNTDAGGFGRGLDEEIGALMGDRVIQFGAGGAGSATAYALASRGVRHIDIVDLDLGRAGTLSKKLTEHFVGLTSQPLTPNGVSKELAGKADGLVNATPVGGSIHPGSLVSATWHRPDLWVADVVYTPLTTSLVTNARQTGARAAHGGLMLAYQAAMSFELFHGIKPNADRMRDHLVSLRGGEVAT